MMTSGRFAIMERSPRTIADANQLIQLGKLLNETIETVIDEWSQEKYPTKNTSLKDPTNGTNGVHTAAEASEQTSDSPQVLPSRRLHQA